MKRTSEWRPTTCMWRWRQPMCVRRSRMARTRGSVNVGVISHIDPLGCVGVAFVRARSRPQRRGDARAPSGSVSSISIYRGVSGGCFIWSSQPNWNSFCSPRGARSCAPCSWRNPTVWCALLSDSF